MDNSNSTLGQQPNTFMDIIGPKPSISSPRSMPAKSVTLRRDAVKKPDPPVTVVNIQNDQTAQPAPLVTPRTDLTEAASLTQQSPLISHFGSEQQANLDSQAIPESNEIGNVAAGSVAPAPVIEPSNENSNTALEAHANDQPLLNVFKNLQTSATQAPAEQSKSGWKAAKKVSGWSALAIAVLIFVGGGIFINRNFSRIELHLASSRAGFSAKLPSISPSGYDLGSISTSSGVIEASFKSNSDSRSYSISEKRSSLTATSLLDGYVQNQAGTNYQTVTTINGLTVYIYNGHNATWVSGGIWYVVQDNNSLSDNQIINIASSM